MIRRVVRLRRGLLYAHLRHDFSTASRDSGAARGRPLPRAMPRNAATAPAAIPCRAPLRLKRGSRHSLLQQPVAGRRWCAKRVTATTRARPILTLLPSKHDDSFNALGSNVDCSGSLHRMSSTPGRRPRPGEWPLGPGALQCPLAMNAIGNRHWLAALVSCSNSAVDRSILQARSRPCRNSSASNNAALGYASAQAANDLPAKRRGNTGIPRDDQCGLRGGGGRSSHDGFCPLTTRRTSRWRTRFPP